MTEDTSQEQNFFENQRIVMVTDMLSQLKRLDDAVGKLQNAPTHMVWYNGEGNIEHSVELDERAAKPALTILKNLRTRLVDALRKNGVSEEDI
jgi:hypothetical protein